MVKDLGNMQMQQLVDTGEYLLVPVRGFYYAYGSGAFALSRVMSYRVVRRRSENGEVNTVWTVLLSIIKQGIISR